MSVHVRIHNSPSDFVPLYDVTFTGVSAATRLLLLSFRRELVSMVPIDPTKIENQEYVDTLNKKYMQSSEILIDKYLPGTSQETKDLLIAYILNMMLGMGDLEAPLADDNLEEITVNGSREV